MTVKKSDVETAKRRLLDQCKKDSADLVGILRGYDSISLEFEDIKRRISNLESQNYIINDIPKIISENVKSGFEREQAKTDKKFADIEKALSDINISLNGVSKKVQPVVDGKKRIDNILQSLGLLFIITLILGLSSAEARKLATIIMLGG